jgi:hypothetical protein
MFKHREEYRRLGGILEERLKRGMYGEEYHRIEMAMAEIELANLPPTLTEEERNEYRKAASDLRDLRIALGEHSGKHYRRHLKTRPKGKPLPWGTSKEHRLIALAKRLGIDTEKYPPLQGVDRFLPSDFTESDLDRFLHSDLDRFLHPPDGTESGLILDVCRALIREQPEFEPFVVAPGRPPRATNK